MMTIKSSPSTIPIQDAIYMETSSSNNNNNSNKINSAQKPSWWMNLTQMEKSLCALVTLTILICLALISVIVLFTCPRFNSNGHHRTSSKPWTLNSNSNSNNNNILDNKTNTTNGDNTKGSLLVTAPSETILDSFSGDDDNGNFHGGKHDESSSPLLIPSSNHDHVCMTPSCIKSSAQILTNLDLNADPCDDFYQFACGGWIENQLIPDEKTALSVFSQNQDDLNVKLRALVEQRQTTKDDPPIVTQMKNIYKSCTNLTQIEIEGNEPLLNVLRSFGGWPVVGASTGWNEATTSEPSVVRSTNSRRLTEEEGSTRGVVRSARSRTARNGNVSSSPRSSSPSPLPRRLVRQTSDQSTTTFNWLDTLIKFRQRGFSHDILLDLSVVPDVKNNTRFIIDLDQSSLGLPDRSYFLKGLNDSTVSAYYELMVESAVILGADRDRAKSELLDVLNFETSLARMSMPRDQRRNITRLYNKMKVSDLSTLAPHIDWQKYLDNLLKDHIELDEDVIVKVPNYLTGLDELLQKTHPRLLANYMIWRVVRQSMGLLGKRWREPIQKYSTITTGRQREEPRWEQCMGTLSGTLGTALSALYVKNHFKKESKLVALEMVNYIRKEFLKMLGEVDWMDEETRAEAKKKAHAITPYIGYPDEILEDHLIEELYSGLHLTSDNYFQNVRNLRIWATNYSFNLLRKLNEKGDWKKHSRAAIVNAFYNSLENSIEFPAGILQGAFFNADRPNYLNYGAIGFIIGHEITHGFDDRGRQFDMEGNNRNWWKPKTDERFKERTQCIIDQYSNYTVPENGLKVNGLNTQGENIADNGGVKEAFRAYNQWVKDHGQEGKLPGLNLSPKQLFWVSAASIWCGKFRPEVLRLRVNAGVHSPAKFRIIGPLSNLNEFSDTFKCPEGSPMNPKKKCSVW